MPKQWSWWKRTLAWVLFLWFLMTAMLGGWVQAQWITGDTTSLFNFELTITHVEPTSTPTGDGGEDG